MTRFEPPPWSRSPRRGATALVLVALLALAAVGCSTPSASGDVATLSDVSSTTTPSSESETSTDPEEAMRQFAECMREHGVDMADPSASGGGGALISKADGDSETMKAADAACQYLMQDVAQSAQAKMDPAEEAKMKDQALAFAKCMREHGVDLPDPQFLSDGQATQKQSSGGASTSSSGVDPESPAFKEAQDACQEFVPDGAITHSDSGDGGNGPSMQLGADPAGGDQ